MVIVVDVEPSRADRQPTGSGLNRPPLCEHHRLRAFGVVVGVDAIPAVIGQMRDQHGPLLRDVPLQKAIAVTVPDGPGVDAVLHAGDTHQAHPAVQLFGQLLVAHGFKAGDGQPGRQRVHDDVHVVGGKGLVHRDVEIFPLPPRQDDALLPIVIIAVKPVVGLPVVIFVNQVLDKGFHCSLAYAYAITLA